MNNCILRWIFYWFATFCLFIMGWKAKVPIILGFIDYKKKIAGIGLVFNPCYDINADMKLIKAFYSDFLGRYPDQPSTN
ncbi:hypothetical protein [Desulfobacula sp.]|uniref:hypothetical protein n=1 Tax=Desulfobacula sp. TaxID=2593537 RepID=UPI001DC3B87E|nr:hypothetical protein [Desulfobacula sp.]MBT7049629.1 hypothetical protein [Desulfobacula sp.]